MEILGGILIPFAGTSIGAAGVFFLKKNLNKKVQKILYGFAAGVMVAACVWSLLIPSMRMVEEAGGIVCIPAVTGFIIGVLFILLMDKMLPVQEAEESRVTQKLLWAVTLHNLPEGMAVGVAFAGAAVENDSMLMAGAFALAVGIAVQNIPEGTIIAMPLAARGIKKWKAFLVGVLSGAVEPIGAVLTILLARFVIPVLPYLLSFSAGAMICVVVSDLIPESMAGEKNDWGVLSFTMGFLVMMSLDVILG